MVRYDKGDVTISEAARRTACPIETIRYYERIGLVAPPPRNGKYRAYRPEDLARLGFIRRARELGFGLDAIRALLRLAASGSETCANMQMIAEIRLADIRARIADLAAMEHVLAETITRCEFGNDAACPLIEVLSQRVPLIYSPESSRRR
ncbi:helix-turn-helix domain-containing protein [Acidiphilium sp. AL]|uniref:Helix-turn-helix domain-containing protein n=1 Tax=Acidiphilium iwatense TaxID=768198 RepID=A0ABS9DXK0_9PROT|nr:MULTISPECIES: helix-turn-helix domain-containing protein [Acidiphilium]MCF3946167.1 helix-turn-helix domain-containing protein [Acidiphilium iwatense]MCU4158511.1 helix-turn-helix domain-containing protein [Acidiphilium sp. AL]